MKALFLEAKGTNIWKGEVYSPIRPNSDKRGGILKPILLNIMKTEGNALLAMMKVIFI